jgi:alpha-1,3-mannosyl-glycoprotein beta-1,2-N-acetylglucosaminyltransferase
VCRTFNFGEIGASRGQFFKRYLKTIRLAGASDAGSVDWAGEPLEYLEAGRYDASVRAALDAAIEVRHPSEVETSRAKALGTAEWGEKAPDAAHSGDNLYVARYDGVREFEALARRFGVFPETKDGVPRAGYRGVVTFKMHRGRATVMLAPEEAEGREGG